MLRIEAVCVGIVAAGDVGSRPELSQKTEQPARNRQGVESYEERKSETDDFLTSPEANRDTEVLGTEVGVADAMRFQGAAPELINSRYPVLACAKPLLVHYSKQWSLEKFANLSCLELYVAATIATLQGNSLQTHTEYHTTFTGLP